MNNHFGHASIMSRSWLPLLAVSLLAVVTVSQDAGSANSQPTHVTRVREFVAAFNDRKLEAMLGAVDDDIQWLSIKDGKVTIETEGKNALRESMEKYFRSCLTCKSTLEWVKKSGSRVTAMERATWTSKSGRKSQRSLSVYEFHNGRILRVYYFPVDSDPPSTALKK